MTTVNIVTSDRGWILERLARELARNLPYVTFGDGPDPAAGIQYYMTFACRRRRLSPVEVAYFAHLEPLGEAHDRFFAVAREVEHSVCHARLYEAVLREAGVGTVTTIPPGVDLETFAPRLRIGVVGRTYHTGRKGEHLVAEVMDIPEIEWRFTGEGWPGPALDLPAEALPDFYRGLDYVLVPSLYEGGPMCVVEALACGTEVIAPPIGWVPEFPHVEFKAGDAADLRRVLLDLVEKKRALRASVLDRGWDAWIEGHDRLFRDLAGRAGLVLGPPAATRRPPAPRRVGLFLHGNEPKSQGGPTVRVPRLARELREAGIEADLRAHPAPEGFSGLDLVHGFNAWAPHSALDLLRRAKRAGLPTVFSPIFLDSGLRDLWEDRLVRLFAEAEPGPATHAALAAFRDELAARRADPAGIVEASPGFHAAVREMVGLADRLILLSERERERLAAIGAPATPADIVHNPVDAAFFAKADPALFRRETGLDEFVLCVARLEPRKNQLMLAHALRDSGLPLVLVGHAGSDAYRAQIERHAGPGLRILDRLPPNSPLLASAFAAARVAVLPSWSEGAPLAALEAAAAGAALVLSDQSGEREYFGDLARYCDPADPASIRDAVLEAWETRRSTEEVARQKQHIAERFGWDRHRDATEAAYAATLATARPVQAAPRAAPRPAAPARLPIVFDVTTTAHHKGRWTGIARVEAALALALQADPRAEVRFVTWNNRSRSFNEVPAEAIRAGALGSLLSHFDANPLPLLDLPAGAAYIVGGSAWMQNSVYADSLVGFARTHGLRLTPIIHDIIPTKFPYWFNDGYAPVFEANLATLLGNAERLIAVSAATRRDLEAHAQRVADLALPEIDLLREGDEIGQVAQPADDTATAAVAERLGQRPFVLSVGAIHLRKNHRLLHDAWLKLAERMGPRCPQLVLVGGVAWNGQEVARALRGDPRIAHLVTILEEVEDGTLDWLYRHCLFTVYPSLYEGWGLPVAESLRYGRLCLAADTSSVPEIAPGLVELIDPLDPMAWATRIQFYAGSAAARAAAEARIASGHRLRPWSETAGDLIGLLAEEPATPVRQLYAPGRVVEFADRVASSRIRGAGWHASESWGCWASANRSELRFELAARPTEALVLAVEGRGPPAKGASFHARVEANGTPVGHWMMQGDGLRQLHVVIPPEIAARSDRLEIAIIGNRLLALPAERNETERSVGIGLARAALAPLAALRDVARFFEGAPPTAQRLEIGRRRRLLSDGAAQAMLAGRWIANPAWGMVCADPRPRLELALQELPGSDIEIELGLRPVATVAAPLTLLVLANGAPLGSFVFADDTPASRRVVLPAALRGRADPVTLDLVAAQPRSPAALGLGTLEQPFGFGLLSLDAQPVGGRSRERRVVLAAGAEWRAADAPADLLGPDWHPPEEGGCWSFSRRAVLPLLLPGRAAGITLSLAVEAFQPAPGAGSVALEVRAGGHSLAQRSLAPHEAAVLVLAVPPEACGRDGALDLEIGVDAAVSPLAAGVAEDERPLGIRLVGVARAAAASLAPDAVIGFALRDGERGLPPATAALLLGEWFPPEAGGCWSRGEQGELLVAPSAELPAGWRAFAAVRVVGAPATVDIELEGRSIDHWAFDRDSFFVAEIRGLAARIAPGDSATIAFRRRNAVSPRDLGRNQDGRVLGVMLLGLVAVGPEGAEPRATALFAEAGMGQMRSLRTPDVPAPPPRPAPAAPGTVPAATPLPAPGALGATRYDLRATGEMPGLGLLQWHPPEAEGRWSHGDYGEIHLTPPAGGTPRRLEIAVEARLNPAARPGPARAELRLEGGPAQWIDFADDAFVTARLGFDVADLEYDGPALCLFLRRTGDLPAGIAGGDEDDRELGIMVRRLDVTWR